MLPSQDQKAYIVSYCQTLGAENSKCTKCKEEDVHPNCSFYQKASQGNGCSNIRMGEYCSNFHACDFSDGKDVHIENIPNMPSNNTKMLTFHTAREFIDSPYGRREIRRTPEGRTVFYNGDNYTEWRDTVFTPGGGGGELRKEISPYPSGLQELDDEQKGVFEYELVFNPDNEDDHIADMSEMMGEFEAWEDSRVPCAEISVGTDNSGTMTPERFLELADMLAESLRNKTLSSFMPVIKHVTTTHLQDCYNSFCGAYSEKFKLFLDMSSNPYTIYRVNGTFISLRQLFKDGISPFELNFKMQHGDTCFEGYGFEEFTEQIERMLEQGR